MHYGILTLKLLKYVPRMFDVIWFIISSFLLKLICPSKRRAIHRQNYVHNPALLFRICPECSTRVQSTATSLKTPRRWVRRQEVCLPKHLGSNVRPSSSDSEHDSSHFEDQSRDIMQQCFHFHNVAECTVTSVLLSGGTQWSARVADSWRSSDRPAKTMTKGKTL